MMDASGAEGLSRATRPFIDLIDTLRRHGVQQDLPLPQIAVMGDQSAGKSSVLELISGVPFPRGSGLVTRCATQLVMKRTAPGTVWSATASVSWPGPQPPAAGIVKDRESLGRAIEQLTQVLCSGSSNSFSTHSIVIELRSPDVPDLTLLDLPGIVRTNVAGQDASVVKDVNTLIDSYLRQERTIVLAVMPANQDVATIDILERAAAADPAGQRTLAVLTKPDLVDEGAEDEVASVLSNRRKPLRLGYAMVRCRTQRQLDSNISLTDALKAEAAFFESHAFWGKAQGQEWQPQQLGVVALTRRLSSLLVDRIKVALPSIKYELQQQYKTAIDEYERLGGARAIADAASRRGELVRVVAEYTTLLRQSARGNYGHALLARNAELRLFGEAQAAFKVLKDEVALTQPRFEDRSFVARLTTEMNAFRGRELPGFTNSQVFYGFMVQNIEEWRPHVDGCRMRYIAAARQVSEALVYRLAPNYPALAAELRVKSHCLMDDFGDKVQTKLDDVFAKESDPYTTNESMLELINAIRNRNFDVAMQAVVRAAPPAPFDADGNGGGDAGVMQAHVKRQLGKWYMQTHGVNTTSKVEDMCTLLQAYWDVATKRLVDNVCMTLEHDFTAKLLNELEAAAFLYAAELGAPDKALDLERLFREDPTILEARRLALGKKTRIEQALASLAAEAPDVVAQAPRDTATEAPKSVSGGFASERATRPPPPLPGAARWGAAVAAPAPPPQALARPPQERVYQLSEPVVTKAAGRTAPPAAPQPGAYSVPDAYASPPAAARAPPAAARAPPPPLHAGDGAAAAMAAVRDPAVRSAAYAAAPAAAAAARDPGVRAALYGAAPALYAAAPAAARVGAESPGLFGTSSAGAGGLFGGLFGADTAPDRQGDARPSEAFGLFDAPAAPRPGVETKGLFD
ncbi:P-loop containing nucleoside triphosphate hydrolase protein [Pelagophyceae sp. CCMP2097]|nr:P-loop containing nucleoside triphosphate hydrolase protein [Pelagophyceae sp. CCMP2097]